MAKSLLLASFVEKSKLYEALDKISEACNIEKDRIFVFINESNPSEYILTFNISAECANIKFSSIWENTISVHRKKQTNTLYSINAMNELIKEKNGGNIDPRYKIDWEKYRNKFLLIRNGRVREVGVRLVKINQ